MTAAPPLINGARRALCVLLAVAVAWTPWALTWGQDLFGQAARDGQAFGTTLGADPVRLTPFAHPDDFRVYFPGADAGDVADWTAFSDDPAGAQAAGWQAQSDLVATPFAEASPSAQAYQTLTAPVGRARPTLEDDPLWTLSDATTLSLDSFAATYGDCTWESTFLDQPTTVHVPAYEACLIADKVQPEFTCAAGRALSAQIFWDPIWGEVTDEDGNTTIEIIGYTRRPVIDQDSWSWSPACQAGIDRVKDGFCRSTVTCTSNANADCIGVTGGELCGGELAAPPYHGVSGDEPWENFSGIGAACMAVSVSLDCTRFNEGAMDCWTDPTGEEQCPDNPGDQANCTTLEANAQCQAISDQCAEDGLGKTGVCYVRQRVYDCGTEEDIANTTRISDLNCGGEIRCLGDDCASFTPEQSSDFGAAVAALQAAEFVTLDSDCSSGTCQVFKGTASDCKRAVGGIVNCCKTPDGISLGNYLQLIFKIAKLDSVTMTLNAAGTATPGFGAWETLRSPLVDTWSAVQDGFTSAVNNVTGNTAAATTEAAKEGVISAFKQQLMQQTAQWTANLFGPQAANLLFADAATGGAAFAADGTALTTNVGLGGVVGTVLLYVMWAYLIYTIVMILIHLIWECTEDEFKLGAQRALKSCHRIGSYCKKTFFGACIESRDSYCCFNSPLSRILSEQIKGQLGLGFGSAKHPNCAGIGVETLAHVNWAAIDLREWLQMLTAANLVITPAKMTFADLTEGQNNRTATRLENLQDVNSVAGFHREAETQGWSETLPALPRPAPE
ncbi:conjugal transfer protein TraN [Thiocystis minor]|uniref:conjugal transfer protein TraN n=1 Tax=Thiocystis minor TaxID=61597 RepID=UPI00191248B4|nr:conjugal transfer protein TraN [Thiocystis minor]MBK5966748.1 conjugal transfer protein TraN [Thiocystis minor]